MIRKIFSEQGNKIFIQTDEKSYDYYWLQQRIKKNLGLFNDLNLKVGDRILVAVSNDVEMSSIFLAALTAGITVIIADPEMKSPRARAIIYRSKPNCLVADKTSLAKWELEDNGLYKILPYIKPVRTAGILGKFLKKQAPPEPGDDFLAALERSIPREPSSATVPDEKIAYILYTSGTTADSKGVAISYGNLYAHLETLSRVYDLNPASNIFNQLLLCHADGSIQGPVLAAYAGCTLHRPYRFSIEKIPSIMDYCYANNISHLVMVPAMLNMLVQFGEGLEDSFSYPEFKAIISVSAHLDAALWDKFATKFNVNVNNVYGLTETVAGSLFCGPLAGTYKKYTVGKAIDCETKIVNESGKEIQAGETGELLLKGGHIMKAYWDDEKTSAETFKDGWFCTGDLASMDEDGFITIRGRKKNLIISGGINIQPEEVTECLLQHSSVSEACAIGLPDDVFGEKLVAAIVLKPNDECSSTNLIEHCRKLLDDKKVPQRIYILESLPKGVSGKVQINALKEQLISSAASNQDTFSEIPPEVIKVAAGVFQVPESTLSTRDTSYTVAGWDSLAHLIFITELEQRFTVRFTTAEVMTMNSIHKAVELVTAKTCIAQPV